MTFDASHALRFINRARAATGLPALTELPFTGAVRVDERACLLARALQAEVGGSADPRFRDHFVVRLGDQALARAVASRTGQPCNDHAEVLLPEPLARLAVAFDRGQVERRAARYVPLGQLSFDDLETAACQAVAVVSDSSAGHSTKAEHRSSPWPAPRDHSSSPTTPSRAGARHSRPRLRSAVGAVYRTPAALRSPAPAAARSAPTAVTASPASARAPGSDGRRCLAGYRGAHKPSGRRPDRARPRARRCRGGVVGPRRRDRAGAFGRPRSHELRRPRGQGRRSADPGGTDAARAARPHDDSLHTNGMPPNQPLRQVPRPRRAVLQAPRVPGTERRPNGGTSPSTANSLSCMSAPFDVAGEALRRLPTRACEDRRPSRRPRTAYRRRAWRRVGEVTGCRSSGRYGPCFVRSTGWTDCSIGGVLEAQARGGGRELRTGRVGDCAWQSASRLEQFELRKCGLRVSPVELASPWNRKRGTKSVFKDGRPPKRGRGGRVRERKDGRAARRFAEGRGMAPAARTVAVCCEPLAMLAPAIADSSLAGDSPTYNSSHTCHELELARSVSLFGGMGMGGG